MKKLLSILFTMAMSVGMAFADRVQIGDLYYNLDDVNNTAEVTRTSSPKGYVLDSLVIPSTVEYASKQYTVTSIDSAAFQGSTIKSPVVNLPNTITHIKDDAFTGQNWLWIYIPNSVISIGYRAFHYVRWIRYEDTSRTANYDAFAVNGYREGDYVYTDSAYTELQVCLAEEVIDLQLPAQIKKIGNHAFWRCELDSVILPDSLEVIGSCAFEYCSLNFVHLPAKLRVIEDHAFNVSWPYGMDSISIPQSVEDIGNYAFLNCPITKLEWNTPNISLFDNLKIPIYQITSMHIGNVIDSIPASFFEGLTALENLSIGRNVRYIENRALKNCTALRSVYWNASHYTAKASPIFAGISSNITSFVFGENVETIPEYLCYSMKSISSVTIPQSVTFIGNCAFYECNNLKEIHVPDLAAYCNIDFGGDPNWYLYADLYVNGEKITTNLVIPDGTTTLHSYAFKFKSITTVTLPASLQVAENDPFYDILNIHVPSVAFWLNLDKQGYVASYRSGSTLYVNDEIVRAIIIPKEKTNITDYEFTWLTSIKFVSIHRNVQTIGTRSFYHCSGLDSIYDYATLPQTVSAQTFEGLPKNYKCKFHIPRGTIEAYRAAGWNLYIDPTDERYRNVYDDLYSIYVLDQAIIAATQYHDSLIADYVDIADSLMMAIEVAQTIADTATTQDVVDAATQTLNEAIATAHDKVAARLAILKNNFEAYKQTYIDILDSVKNVFSGGEYRQLFEDEGNPEAYISRIHAITYDSLMTYPSNIAVVDSMMNWIQNDIERVTTQIIVSVTNNIPELIYACQQLHEEGDSEACDSLIAAAVAALENYEYDITRTESYNFNALYDIYRQLEKDLAAQREKDRQQDVETINEEEIRLRKTIRDGRLIIEHGKKVFTVTGNEL